MDTPRRPRKDELVGGGYLCDEDCHANQPCRHNRVAAAMRTTMAELERRQAHGEHLSAMMDAQYAALGRLVHQMHKSDPEWWLQYAGRDACIGCGSLEDTEGRRTVEHDDGCPVQAMLAIIGPAAPGHQAAAHPR